jgi:hypothetical protein
VEDAGDHPERQVRSHQDRRSSHQASNDRDWE